MGLGVQKIFFPKFNQIWCVSYLHEWHMQQHNFFVPHLLGPWGGAKRSNIIKSHYKVNFKDFYTKLCCLLTNERYKTYQTRFSFGHLGHVCPRVWDLGCAGGQKLNFLNTVMWHIKLKGMSSRPRYTENFYPRIKLVTLRWGQRIKYHLISSRAWGFAMAL